MSATCDHKFVDSKRCLKCGWQPDPKACRACGECDGNHHWLDSCGDDDDPCEPHYVCKHCEVRADMCGGCGDGVIFPVTGATLCAECTADRGDFEP